MNDKELIKALSRSLGEVECITCGHEYRFHLDTYGCEREIGDCGPCGCQKGCNPSPSPQDQEAIECLELAKRVML